MLCVCVCVCVCWSYRTTCVQAEQQLQRVCDTSYPILPDICPKLQTALFVGVRPVNPALISRATELLMGGLARRTVQLADVFKVIHQVRTCVSACR